ncbi:MAG TPA: TIGR01458 family HAD-type hydrolase [Thermoanaerobaculia bacterium]|nr:TIGR01458 family HAD-type hydrolase [Thermoanaerobaculia bacterium]
MPLTDRIQGCLIDLDGTVYQEGRAIIGAAEAIEALRRAEIPFRFATNTTRLPRAALAERLAGLGIRAAPGEILSAPSTAARWLRSRGIKRVRLLLARESWREFEGLKVDDRTPQYVVVGDLGEEWTFEILNGAFRNLMEGAELLAIQRNRYWHTDGGLSLDAGPFVAALEYATGKTAILAGKPSPAFFEAAARELGLPPDRIAVIGDDLEGDVVGARQAGMIGVAVRTGKYRPADEERIHAAADLVIDSLRWPLTL